MHVIMITENTFQEDVLLVSDALKRLGLKPVRFDAEKFPTEIQMGLYIDNQTEEIELITTKGRFTHKSIKAIYMRGNNFGAKIPETMNIQLRSASLKETHACVEGFVGSVDAMVLDEYWYVRRAQNLSLQLQVATNTQLEIQKVLITNNIETVKAFAKTCKKGIVCKEQRIGLESHHNTIPKHLIRMSNEGLKDLSEILIAPMIFQENLDFKALLRLTVVADSLFVAGCDDEEILSNVSSFKDEKIKKPHLWRVWSIPEVLKEKIFKFMRYFKLQYGVIHMVQTRDENFIFLELDPLGAFFWLDNLQDVRVSDTIAKVLRG